MFNARLAGDHLYGKWLFTWLSLVISLMMSYFVLSFFPRDDLGDVWDWIESVPEDFSYILFNKPLLNLKCELGISENIHISKSTSSVTASFYVTKDS